MESCNCLSKNLKAYQKLRTCSLTEFSRELDVSKSTLQSVMKEGNTTLDTLLRIQKALGISLDALVYGQDTEQRLSLRREALSVIASYEKLAPEDRERFRLCLNHLMDLLDKAND